MQNLDPLACVTHSLVDYVISLLILTSRIEALLKVIVSSRQFLGGNMLENLSNSRGSDPWMSSGPEEHGERPNRARVTASCGPSNLDSFGHVTSPSAIIQQSLN
jgi:hypothetical protein